MPDLKKILRARLKGAERIALLGVGSELRGDDAAGVTVAEKLAAFNGQERFHSFVGATAPENLTGEIKKFSPTHIIIVDTAEIRQKPGTALVLTADEVGEGISFSTHKMPLVVMIKYFQTLLKCDFLIIGIQPETLEFDKPLSAGVRRTVEEVVKAISGCLEER